MHTPHNIVEHTQAKCDEMTLMVKKFVINVTEHTPQTQGKMALLLT